MYEWKTTPIEALLNGPLVARLKEAGFNTAGDILDTDADVIADRTAYVGPKRADQVRSDVLNALINNSAPKVTIIEHDQPGVPLWLLISALLVVGLVCAIALNSFGR